MADEEPRAGELTTANYGWTKPTVAASDDAWGGYLNTDLDGIDSTVKSVSTVANAAYPASNPAGYITAAAIPAPYVLPTASTTVLGGVKVDGTTVTIASGTISATASAPYVLPPASTTVLGGVKVDGTTIKAAGDGTISTTVVPLGDNRIINGAFSVNQRGYVSGTALAAAAYGIDRWKAGTGGCTYTFTAAVPDTTITITANTLTQIIEAGMIEGGVYTLSWTGTAQARVYQGTPTGSYAASPVVTSSLTTGTNTIVEFNAGTLTKVKLEIGSVATPFNRQSLAKSTADCQRYYQLVSCSARFPANAANNYNSNTIGFQTMRSSPTALLVTAGTIGNVSTTTLGTAYLNSAIFNIISTAAGDTYNLASIYSLSAEL